MRSIIDEIAEAERRADEIRAAAVQKSREAISYAQSDAETALADADMAERAQTRSALAEAETDGDAIAQDILARMEREADEACRAAETRSSEAVAYLLKKVTVVS